jgi:hypothetical protein
MVIGKSLSGSAINHGYNNSGVGTMIKATPALHKYQTYRTRGNGRIRTALVVLAIALAFMAGQMSRNAACADAIAKHELQLFYDALGVNN